jgi:hypothetical protein
MKFASRVLNIAFVLRSLAFDDHEYCCEIGVNTKVLARQKSGQVRGRHPTTGGHSAPQGSQADQNNAIRGLGPRQAAARGRSSYGARTTIGLIGTYPASV